MSIAEPLYMSLDEWLAWDYEGKSEWVDGEVIVSPPPTWGHAKSEGRWGSIIERQIPGLVAGVESDIQVAARKVRRPDLAVYDRGDEPDDFPVTKVPIVIGEVLSASNRGEDLVRKTGEYATFGVSQYWIADPQARVFDIFENVGGGWVPLLHLTDANSTGSVAIGDYGTVELDLNELVGPRPERSSSLADQYAASFDEAED